MQLVYIVWHNFNGIMMPCGSTGHFASTLQSCMGRYDGTGCRHTRAELASGTSGQGGLTTPWPMYPAIAPCAMCFVDTLPKYGVYFSAPSVLSVLCSPGAIGQGPWAKLKVLHSEPLDCRRCRVSDGLAESAEHVKTSLFQGSEGQLAFQRRVCRQTLAENLCKNGVEIVHCMSCQQGRHPQPRSSSIGADCM
jgi:hypothetical protein